MFFYIDESGNTGTNLFDENQPHLYYGCLSAEKNLDETLNEDIKQLRELSKIRYLHASELGIQGIEKIIPKLVQLIDKHSINFSLQMLKKEDFAIICFFDQVFDQEVNPAVPWSMYYTPLRYILLINLFHLFDKKLKKLAWDARIQQNDNKSNVRLQKLCEILLSNLHKNNSFDTKIRDVLNDGLNWAKTNPEKIYYNVSNGDNAKQIAPNLICFQSILLAISNELKNNQTKATKIIVDEQSQFNFAQQYLTRLYIKAKDSLKEKICIGPDLPEIELKYMPDIPLTFLSENKSIGLEIADILIWICKRAFERKKLSPIILHEMNPYFEKIKYSEISLYGINYRWEEFKIITMLEDELKKVGIW
jgi:hypothetical protein